MKPRMRLRFGIWSCVTRVPFVCGCGYTTTGAYEEWRRIRAEQDAPLVIEVKLPLIPPDPRALCEEVAAERE